MRADIEGYAQSGRVHTVVGTAANVNDATHAVAVGAGPGDGIRHHLHLVGSGSEQLARL